MAKRPVIGIPCRQALNEWGGFALGNSPTYLTAIEKAGGIPLLLPLRGRMFINWMVKPDDLFRKQFFF